MIRISTGLLLSLFLCLVALTAMVSPAPTALSADTSFYTIGDTTEPEATTPKRKDKKRRDSVPPPPLSLEEIQSQFNSIKYNNEGMSPQELEAKASELQKLRDQASWLVKYMQIQSADQVQVDKAMGVSYQIRTNWAVVNSKLKMFQEDKGVEAMKKFESLTLPDVYDTATQQANMEVITALKEGLFHSKKVPTVNCSGSIGDNLPKGKSIEGIDPRSGCVGYISSLGKNEEFNLIALKLANGDVKIILWGKNVGKGTYGAFKVF